MKSESTNDGSRATSKKKKDVEVHDVPPPTPQQRPVWRQPDDWREAHMLAESGKLNNAAEAQKILDVLGSISWDKPTSPRPNPPRAAASTASPTPRAVIAPPQVAASPARASDDCECVVLGLGQPNPDCTKCGGTGYTGP